MNAIQSSVYGYFERKYSFTPEQVNKWAKIALATILTVGMIFSFAMAAPWFIAFIFFSASLVVLSRVGMSVDNQRDRIKG
jgi:uncharacterized membrane protein